MKVAEHLYVSTQTINQFIKEMPAFDAIIKIKSNINNRKREKFMPKFRKYIREGDKQKKIKLEKLWGGKMPRVSQMLVVSSFRFVYLNK